jgi:hypothetical protein
MEARSELRGSRMSKGLVVVIAVCVTLGLGVTAGLVAKNLNSTTATQTHIVQTKSAPAESVYPAQRTGVQMGDRSGAPAASISSVQRAGLQMDDLIGAAPAAAKPTAVPNPRSVKGLRQI